MNKPKKPICYRIGRHPRTGEEIEVHDDSRLLFGPSIAKAFNGRDKVVYAQFVCDRCGKITNWARLLNAGETEAQAIEKTTGLKPISEEYQAGEIKNRSERLTIDRAKS